MPKHPGKPERHPTARIAGWEGRDGEWRNVEAGARMPSARSLALSRHVTIAVENEQTGEVEYYPAKHLNKNLTIDDVVDQLEKQYDTEFV